MNDVSRGASELIELVATNPVPDSFVKRVETIQANLCRCGFCEQYLEESVVLVASCCERGNYICEDCICDALRIFHDPKRAVLLATGTKCMFCLISTARSFYSRGILNICEACAEIATSVVEMNEPEPYQIKQRNVLSCILFLEMEFARQMDRPSDGFLFERIEPSDYWKAWNKGRWYDSWSKKFSLDEVESLVARLEEIHFGDAANSG